MQTRYETHTPLGVRDDGYHAGPTPSNVPWASKVKAWLWKLITLPFLALIYLVVISEGLRLLVPVLGLKLHKLPLPGFSALRGFEGFYRLDMAHLFSVLLLWAVWYLWTVNLWILFAGPDFFARTRWDPETYTKFVRGLGVVILGADAILFYVGMTQQMGGMFGGGGLSLSALLATVAYVGVIIFVSFVSVNLERS
jgi:hypothetical protein